MRRLALALTLALLLVPATASAKVLFHGYDYDIGYSGSGTWSSHSTFADEEGSGQDTWTSSFHWKFPIRGPSFLWLSTNGKKAIGGFNSSNRHAVDGRTTDQGQKSDQGSWSCVNKRVGEAGNGGEAFVRSGNLFVFPTGTLGPPTQGAPDEKCSSSGNRLSFDASDGGLFAPVAIRRVKRRKATVHISFDQSNYSDDIKQLYCVFPSACQLHLSYTGTLKVRRGCRGKVVRDPHGTRVFVCAGQKRFKG